MAFGKSRKAPVKIDYKTYKLKSKLEFNFALLLDYLDVKWIYEPKKFIFEKIQSGTRVYIPDFFIKTELNIPCLALQVKPGEYVETKGHLDAKSKTKLNRMRIYFPKEKVHLVTWDNYKILETEYGDLVPNWIKQFSKVKKNG